MSLLNNNKKKDKKKGQPQHNTSPIPGAKGKTNTKGISKSAKLTGGSQRGS